jgi:ATP-dependent RNA helicase DeaD
MSTDNIPQLGFEDLQLSQPVMQALRDVGYETPTPIQAEMIPYVMDGRDVLGQAQTGTGKTAAFALPILSKIDTKLKKPQVMVLTPTRELAIQVAEAFQTYAAHIKGFHVLPIYGGQDFEVQLRQLKRGVHVIVGTPGRVMDHMRRRTLSLESMNCLILDEADEMLRMGFIDDVEWILEQAPEQRQIALFSATIPTAIRKISEKYLHNPKSITIKVKTTTAETINQRYWMVSGYHKLDALTRILEAEPFDGIIVFVKTKISTVELSEKLAARGYASSPLNGDIPQNQRERTIERLKKGKLDILVATDVAARGLDVDRISHVINYDIPFDTEAYVHRIGRTGRAGRSGEAILFISPRERRMLRAIEQATNQKIQIMQLPSTQDINDRRIATFKDRISDTLAINDLGFYYQLIEQYRQEHNVPAMEIASALARMVQGDTPLLLENKPQPTRAINSSYKASEDRPRKRKKDPERFKKEFSVMEEGMERFRLEVGYDDDVKPGNIVGAIANEGGIDSKFIGRIEIFDDHSFVDLPEGLPKEILQTLKRTWISGKQLKISRVKDGDKPDDKYKKKQKFVKPDKSRDPKKKFGDKQKKKRMRAEKV